MAASNPILTPDRGKAHSVALVLLCTLAVLQMVAMMRAVWLTSSQNGAAKAAALNQDAAGPAGAPPLPSNVPAVVASPARMAPPSIPASKQAPIKFSAVPPVSAPVVVPAPMMPTLTSASATKAPMDAEMLELIEVGTDGKTAFRHDEPPSRNARGPLASGEEEDRVRTNAGSSHEPGGLGPFRGREAP